MISGKKDGTISVGKQFVRTGSSVGVTVIARYAFGLPNADLKVASLGETPKTP